jgi:glutaredoxin
MVLGGPAWGLYKVVAPDGSITYTDRPPPASAGRVESVRNAASPPPQAVTLPLELREAVRRYPVTLYTAPECGPCDTARQMLQQRGVPYSERRVAGNDDILALEQRLGGRTVPALTIGAQVLRGYAMEEWAGFLDAAGYPRESRLPRGWQPPPVTPLTAERPPAPDAASESPAAPPARPRQAGPGS